MFKKEKEIFLMNLTINIEIQAQPFYWGKIGPFRIATISNNFREGDITISEIAVRCHITIKNSKIKLLDIKLRCLKVSVSVHYLIQKS